MKDLTESDVEQFLQKECINLTLKEIFKSKREKIIELFESYKDELSQVSFYSDKKLVNTIKIPIYLDIKELQNTLKIEVYCKNEINSLLLEMSNIGVVNVRAEHRVLVNKLYGTNFTDKQELYVEQTSRLDIFYKKAAEISINH